MVTCLTKTTWAAFYSDDAVANQCEPFFRGLFDEILAVGRGLGYKEEFLGTTDQMLEAARKFCTGPGSSHKPSTLVDVENWKPFELEPILGEVVHSGLRLGIAIPRLQAIYAMLFVIQNQCLNKVKQS